MRNEVATGPFCRNVAVGTQRYYSVVVNLRNTTAQPFKYGTGPPTL